MSILPLSTKNLVAYAKNKFGRAFKGVYEIEDGDAPDELIDEIENDHDRKSVYILLLIKDGKNIGHWTTIMTQNKGGKFIGEYFDPMGMMSLPVEVVKLFDDFKYNSKVLQKLSDERCGLYTLREAGRFLRR